MAERVQNTSETAIPKDAAIFTAPLGLLKHLKRPEIKMDLVPVLDLLVIALLISLLFTRFVMMPGVRVELPKTDLRMQHNEFPVTVLTIGNEGMLYFDGSVYELSSIEKAFRLYIEASAKPNHVLLIKAQANLELQLFLDLCEMAQTAGFIQVQVAGDAVQESSDIVPVDAMRDSSQTLLPVL